MAGSARLRAADEPCRPGALPYSQLAVSSPKLSLKSKTEPQQAHGTWSRLLRYLVREVHPKTGNLTTTLHLRNYDAAMMWTFPTAILEFATGSIAGPQDGGCHREHLCSPEVGT
jgi:hypothetical protein